MIRFLIVIIFLFFWGEGAFAQELEEQLDDLVPEGGGTFSARLIQGLIAITVLTLAPGILVTTTCFTRFIIALAFLRTGLGLQSTPSNLIMISLALFMTYFVMSPVFETAWRNGVTPLMANQIELDEAVEAMSEPFSQFMQAHVREEDVELFLQYKPAANQEQSPQENPQEAVQAQSVSMDVLVPAFLLSEIRRGFEIGFLILLPFLVIDLVVSTITMSMGMMMLPPTVVSLPFKVLFFVLIDGWNIIVGELLKSVIQ